MTTHTAAACLGTQLMRYIFAHEHGAVLDVFPRRRRERPEGDLVTATGSVSSPDQSTRSVLRRALSIIDALADQDDRCITLTELARRTDLPKPTVFRLINELVRWGGLERNGHCYTLGPRLFMLGESAPTPARLRDVALPYLSDLYEATHENTNLGLLQGRDVVFLARLAGHRSSQMRLRLGLPLPAHSTATGKVLLAYSPPEYLERVLGGQLQRKTAHTIVMPGVLAQQLRSIAERGYAINGEEATPGIVAVAAPIFDANKAVVAAISIAGRRERINITRIVPTLTGAAANLSRLLGSEAFATTGRGHTQVAI